MHMLHAIFFNNLTNYLYFYNKICVIFKCIQFMHMHELHASIYRI